MYRYKGGKWRVVKRLRAVNKDTTRYTKYVAKTRLTKKGKYRFRAYTPTMDGWAPAKSRAQPGPDREVTRVDFEAHTRLGRCAG